MFSAVLMNVDSLVPIPNFIIFGWVLFLQRAQLDSSVGSIADLRTGGGWFDPPLGQYSFRGLMIEIVTGFIPISQLSIVSTMVTWESSQWLGKSIVWRTPAKHG